MPLETTTTIKVSCDGPNCGIHYSWDPNNTKPEELPDGAFRLITIALFNGLKKVFCSKACLMSWFRDYVPLKSIRQIDEEQKAAQGRPDSGQTENPTSTVIPGAAEVAKIDAEAGVTPSNVLPFRAPEPEQASG